MTTSIDSAARCTPESLRDWCREYDGSPIGEGCAPRLGITVGILDDAAARIEELEKSVIAMRASAYKHTFLDLCVMAVKASWAKDEAKVARIMAATYVIEELWPDANEKKTAAVVEETRH